MAAYYFFMGLFKRSQGQTKVGSLGYCCFVILLFDSVSATLFASVLIFSYPKESIASDVQLRLLLRQQYKD